MMTAETYYLDKKSSFEKQNKTIRRKMGWVSLLRLLTMILFVFFFVRSVKTGIVYWYPVSGLWLVTFIALVNYHRNLKLKRDKTQALVDINSNELKALEGDYSMFDNGSEFLNSHHEFTYDLDIFGEKSLFQFVNRTCTGEGKNRLARDLLNSPFQKDQIMIRQEIYRELAEMPDFMQDFRSTGQLAEDNPEDKNEITDWLKQGNFHFSVFRQIMMYAIPVLFILIFALRMDLSYFI